MTRSLAFRLAVAATLLGALVVAIALLGSGEQQQVRTDGDRPPESALPRYAGPPLSTPQSQVEPAEPDTGTAAAPAVEVGPPATAPAGPTATTSADPPDSNSSPDQCRNSFNAACGAFYFSPPRPENQPAAVEVSFEPATPTAGEPVVVTLTGSDPDATSGSLRFRSSCRSDAFACDGGLAPTRSVERCSEPYGAWDTPPPPTESLALSHSFTVFFDQPGDHQYSASIETTGPLPAVWATTDLCRPQNLYGSHSTTDGIVTVIPAPDPQPRD